MRAVGQFGNVHQNIITTCTNYKAHVYVRSRVGIHDDMNGQIPNIARDLWSGTTPIRSCLCTCMVDYEWLRRRPESSARGGTGKREFFEAYRN